MLEDQDEDMGSWDMDNMDSPQTALLVDKRRADWHTVRSRIHIIILSITIFGVIVVIVVIIVIVVTIVVSIIVKRTSWQTATGRQRRWIRDTQTDTQPGSTSGHSADASPTGNLQLAISYFTLSTFLPFYGLVGTGPKVFSLVPVLVDYFSKLSRRAQSKRITEAGTTSIWRKIQYLGSISNRSI